MLVHICLHFIVHSFTVTPHTLLPIQVSVLLQACAMHQPLPHGSCILIETLHTKGKCWRWSISCFSRPNRKFYGAEEEPWLPCQRCVEGRCYLISQESHPFSCSLVCKPPWNTKFICLFFLLPLVSPHIEHRSWLQAMHSVLWGRITECFRS